MKRLHAISMLFPYLNLSSSLISAGLGTEVCEAVARHSRPTQDTSSLAWMKTGLILMLPTWIVVCAIIVFGQKLLFSGEAPSYRVMAASYSFWYLAFFPVMAAGAVMGATMRGRGNTMRASALQWDQGCVDSRVEFWPGIIMGSQLCISGRRNTRRSNRKRDLLCAVSFAYTVLSSGSARLSGLRRCGQ